MFTLEQKQILLSLAREAVETYLRTGEIIDKKFTDPALNQRVGAFVTIYKNGGLRGCLGLTQSDEPLFKTVINMAVAASTEDPRFNPVEKNELQNLEYEISILTPFKKVKSWKEIEINKHGVMVKQKGKSGLFLPQVAKENDWDIKTFLTILCQEKAGLPGDAWQNPQTELLVFEAEVIK